MIPAIADAKTGLWMKKLTTQASTAWKRETL
jgi:hypothetical protein